MGYTMMIIFFGYGLAFYFGMTLKYNNQINPATGQEWRHATEKGQGSGKEGCWLMLEEFRSSSFFSTSKLSLAFSLAPSDSCSVLFIALA